MDGAPQDLQTAYALSRTIVRLELALIEADARTEQALAERDEARTRVEELTREAAS